MKIKRDEAALRAKREAARKETERASETVDKLKEVLSEYPLHVDSEYKKPGTDGLIITQGCDLSLTSMRTSSLYVAIRWTPERWPRLLRKYSAEKKAELKQKREDIRAERIAVSEKIAAKLTEMGVAFRGPVGGEIRLTPDAM